MSKKEALKEESLKLGLDITGFTDSHFLQEEALNIIEIFNNGLIPPLIGWNKEKIISFCSPESLMKGTKSVIMTALPYYEERKDNTQKEPFGEVAMYTWRNNYKFLRKKLEKLGTFIKHDFNGKYKVFVNGPLAEKPLAKKAGIGFYGKNSILYTEKYGSRIVLGGIVTDLELVPDKSKEKKNCSHCSLCIKNCPTGAIIEPYILDRRRCIQYLGQHIEEDIPKDYIKVWGKRLYGCTLCQDICPLNKNIMGPKELSPYGVIANHIPLLPFLELSEEEFRKKYKDNQISAGWINFNALKRNARLILSHSYQGD